jgi:hypothetical protein
MKPNRHLTLPPTALWLALLGTAFAAILLLAVYALAFIWQAACRAGPWGRAAACSASRANRA